MDLARENRIATMFLEEETRLGAQTEKGGFRDYLNKPNVRVRLSSRFLTNTVHGVQQANRAVEVNEMWRTRGKEIELENEKTKYNSRIEREKRKNLDASGSSRKRRNITISGYNNGSNPFGDSNLTKRFVWRKKIERDVFRGLKLKISVRSEKRRQRERMSEIEKIKKSKEERDLEKKRREEEHALLARERARAEFQDWEKKQEEFNFHQSKVKSEIRLREGRAKPIDVLLKNLDVTEEFDIVLEEPYMVINGLTAKEMEELHEDIKMHQDFDKESPLHVEYWEALIVICDWELIKARKRDITDKRGLHTSIELDVVKLLEGKTWSELDKMKNEIEYQMRSGKAKVVEYWEAILKRLQIYKAKARLREIQASLLRNRPQRLEKSIKDKEGPITKREISPIAKEIEKNGKAGSFSPVLMHGGEEGEVIDPDFDKAELERNRAAVKVEQQRRIKQAMETKKESVVADELEMKAMKAMGDMEKGDSIFGSDAEVDLDSQFYQWHDKYRPRKPKYFNRVHTGYVWNKYNRTHYDHDNPPPKIVQGYKFNIFYPDLIDKSVTPKCAIEKDESSNGETCIIKFKAGPPYEDIAFRIVNEEWETKTEKGFKSTFERGILQLYFNFKRIPYRR